MSAIAEREMLVTLLDMTRGEAAARVDLIDYMHVAGDALDLFLNQIRLEGLISEHGGLIKASPGQRLGLAIKAVELGADIERVCRALGWLEFEEMAAHVFQENGYMVSRRFRFKAEGRRWEVDLLASQRHHVVCTECKRWSRGMGNFATRKMVEDHLEKTRVLSENLIDHAARIGLRGWRQAIVVPLALSLSPAPMRFYSGVPVVSILQLPSFLSEFKGHLDRIITFTSELPPPKPEHYQTYLRSG